MKIAPRSEWPAPEDNPIVQLILRDEEWITNKELGGALGILDTGHSKLVTAGLRRIEDALCESDTCLIAGVRDRFGARREVRAFSKKAATLIALRHRTTNAAAFRDWVAVKIAAVKHV